MLVQRRCWQGAALAGFVDITGWPDRAPIAPWRAGPTIGEHSDHVLRDLLGFGDEEIAALAIAGAIS